MCFSSFTAQLLALLHNGFEYFFPVHYAQTIGDPLLTQCYLSSGLKGKRVHFALLAHLLILAQGSVELPGVRCYLKRFLCTLLF